MGLFNRLTIVLFLLSSVAALGQVAHDVSSAAQSLNGGTSASWSHTASGSNRYVRVGFGAAGGSAPTASSITYGGSAMTSVATRSDAGLGAHAALYGFVAPSTASQTISITFSTNAYGAAGSVSYTGVHQTTPSGAAVTTVVTSGSNVSVTVTDAVTGDMVSDAVKHYQATNNPIVGAGQTSRWSGDDGSFNENAAASDEAGATSVAMSWSASGDLGDSWVQVAAAIKQAGGAPARRRNSVIAKR
jgi:hypothetical protein